MGSHTQQQWFCRYRGWCCRFMKRDRLSMHTCTRISQRMSAEYEVKILEFLKFMISARTKTCFELSQVGNMDEVPFTFNIPLSRTVDNKGAKIITVKTSCHERTHYTAVLACCIDGT
jgi:hypothetical protein